MIPRKALAGKVLSGEIGCGPRDWDFQPGESRNEQVQARTKAAQLLGIIMLSLSLLLVVVVVAVVEEVVVAVVVVVVEVVVDVDRVEGMDRFGRKRIR